MREPEELSQRQASREKSDAEYVLLDALQNAISTSLRRLKITQGMHSPMMARDFERCSWFRPEA